MNKKKEMEMIFFYSFIQKTFIWLLIYGTKIIRQIFQENPLSYEVGDNPDFL